MPSHDRQEPRDRIVRALIGDGAARIVVVVATDVAREAARRHEASPAAAMAMGRAVTAGFLVATLTKDNERVTLQLLGSGPLGTLTVDAGSAGTARVFVANPKAGGPLGVPPSLGQAVGRTGVVNVIRDLGPGRDFSGQTPIVDGEIDTDVEHYLCQSEQIDSALGCESRLDDQGGVSLAAGVLVQALPHGEGARYVAVARRRLRDGALRALRGEVTAAELLAAVLGDDVDQVTVLPDPLPLRFHCPCSRERAASTLALLGEDDLLNLIREEGQADVTCEFCRARYDFTDVALEGIRQGLRGDARLPS
ncbi:MAG TPA: Hsp33 family molecular chaperone HslO [Polyangia bacterium]|jgi:molecular chaperone Hsp33